MVSSGKSMQWRGNSKMPFSCNHAGSCISLDSVKYWLCTKPTESSTIIQMFYTCVVSLHHNFQHISPFLSRSLALSLSLSLALLFPNPKSQIDLQYISASAQVQETQNRFEINSTNKLKTVMNGELTEILCLLHNAMHQKRHRINNNRMCSIVWQKYIW